LQRERSWPRDDHDDHDGHHDDGHHDDGHHDHDLLDNHYDDHDASGASCRDVDVPGPGGCTATR
jgi:hypothetical protein